jgi:hypothetical protein
MRPRLILAACGVVRVIMKKDGQLLLGRAPGLRYAEDP